MKIYNVGDTVYYRTHCGHARTVVVTAKHDDVKNGHPGFDGKNEEGTYWGYADQIFGVKGQEY